MKRAIFHTLIALLVGIVCFAAGSWLAVKKRSAALLLAYPATPTATAPEQQSLAVESDDDSTARLLGALKIVNPLERSARLYEAIGHIGPEQLNLLLQRAEQIPGEFRDTLRRALFARWLQIDPAGAAKWVRPFVCMRWRRTNSEFYGPDLDSQLTEMWATANPSAAMAEFMKLPLTPGGSELIAETALKLAAGDRAASIIELGKITDAAKRESALKAALGEWAKTEPAAAFAKLALINDPKLWTETASDVLGNWVKKDASAGLAQVDALLPNLSPKDAGIIITNAAKNGGKNAAAWALALPEALRKFAIPEMIHAWREAGSQAEQIEAIEWANREGLLADRSNVSNQLFIGMSNEQLPAVLNLPPSEGRTELISQLLYNLTNDEARRAMDAISQEERSRMVPSYVQGRALKAASTAKLIEIIALVPAGPDAARAATIAGNIMAQRFNAETESAIDGVADPVIRDRMYAAAIRLLDRNFPERTEATLSRITDPVQRDLARVNIIRNAAYESPAKARALLENSPLSAEWKEVIRLGWAEQ